MLHLYDTTSFLDPALQKQNILPHADQVEVQRKPLKLKQHLPVKSRVKQQLQQAQHLHEQRGVARQTRLKAALGPRWVPLLHAVHCLLPFCPAVVSFMGLTMIWNDNYVMHYCRLLSAPQ